MNVDAAEAERGQHRGRQDLAVGHNHAYRSFEVAQALRHFRLACARRLPHG